MHRIAVAALLALIALPALGKSLHWRSLDVDANLDRNGTLHVMERQAIVFDGDWNGGERTFRIGAGQRRFTTRGSRDIHHPASAHVSRMLPKP